MHPDERNAWLGLSLTPGLGGKYYRALLTALGGPEQIYAATVSTLKLHVPVAVAQQIAQGIDNNRIAADDINAGFGGLATKGHFESLVSPEEDVGWGVIRLYRDADETPAD